MLPMSSRIIIPNLHVVLIHYPLGLLIVGTLIELFSFMWSRSSFRTAGRWMILLGALAAVPATFSGIYALADVVHANNPAAEQTWVEAKAASPLLAKSSAWHLLWEHTLYQSIGTAVACLAVVFWLGCSDRARQSFRLPILAVLLASVALFVSGAWHGGEIVYRKGGGVIAANATSQPVHAEADEPTEPLAKFDRLFPLEEQHVVGAGVVVAVALAAIGLSFRKVTATYEMSDDRRPIVPRETTMAGEKAPPNPPTPVAMVRSFNPEIEVEVRPFAPAGRFWLLTFLLGLFTAVGGILVLTNESDALSVARQEKRPVANVLWENVKPEPPAKINRRFAHVIAGSTIVALPIVLAMLARFAPRKRLSLIFFTFLLLVAVSAQIWIGILLLYDTAAGPVTKFNVIEAAAKDAPALQGENSK